MLNLQSKTSEEWTTLAVAHMDEILLDHAHCEKKAASTALSLIFRYPERTHMIRPLSEVAREELEHFELVLSHIERRGGQFEKMSPSPYAGRLMKIVRPEDPERLLDFLMCCAAIEARSCERMTALAGALEPGPLKKLYSGLLACEARHHMLYIDLALEIWPKTTVKERLDVVMKHEADVLFQAPCVPRMHN